MILPITLTIAGAAAILHVWLACRVSRLRRAAQDRRRRRRQRGAARGGCAPTAIIAENMPIFLILLGLSSWPSAAVSGSGAPAILFILARIAHAFGMDRPGPYTPEAADDRHPLDRPDPVRPRASTRSSIPTSTASRAVTILRPTIIAWADTARARGNRDVPGGALRSLLPGDPRSGLEKITIGDLLRRRAVDHGALPALREILTDGGIGRELDLSGTASRADAERPGARQPPRAGRADRGLCQQLPEWVLLEFGAALAGLTLGHGQSGLTRRASWIMCSNNRGPKRSIMSRQFRGSDDGGDRRRGLRRLARSIRHRIALTDHAALFDGA